ncbi:hypothetical protein [Nonomuraea gerenzanensis]|uniref:hypothetical protein n=1 Tax=Nonomuraea gerenzanensis TaxID=93944 RepID=UPI001CD96FC1|nr:hypothetical protein [Nonomuraea gerenzanensis]UBU09576.1 hypothetical protein LCN96_35085 [Nonomuraea gerenzanensis]
MTWIFVSVGLGVAGLVVLGVAGARVVAAARTLKREIAAAQAQLEPRRARLSGQIDGPRG